MNVLVTGAKGFVGRNLVENLKNIRDGKDRTRSFSIEDIYEFTHESTDDQLKEWCKTADFVFNLAGVNRPQDNKDFKVGNYDFSAHLINTLRENKNKCPVMFASSIQASLEGRFKGSEYGQTKKDAEDLYFNYSQSEGVRVFVYRFPNIFGKWCRPNYNSVVATFCNNIANDLPITIKDPSAQLELVYIDDLIESLFSIIEGKGCRCNYQGLNLEVTDNGNFYYVPDTYKITLGKLAELINTFKNQPVTLQMPEIPNDSFEKKLFSTYLSYLPSSKMAATLNSCTDDRGSFIELLKTQNCGQFSVNISKPGITKGNHWHNSKWEIFWIVSGHALIQERKIGSDEISEFEVSGDNIKPVYMLPGYTHNIINLSNEQNLVTLMWANEQFDSKHPDTFAFPVKS